MFISGILSIILCSDLLPTAHSFTSYANDFVDPDYILAKDFNSTTLNAQQTIVTWAQQLAAQGPWSVVNKTVEPPSGDLHDYLSWAPYSWPNCTSVGNTTELTPEEIWTTCPYYTRDGVFNPDGRLVNDTGAFSAMADAVLYNSLAWVITGSSEYSTNVASFVNSWFLNSTTAMNPNLNYGQLKRGPDGQTGQHTGVLDLKCIVKLVSGVLILRKGNAAEWTSDMDSQLISWVNQYVSWLQTSTIALQEAAATNNHGTFYYNQLAALQILANNSTSAAETVAQYFSTLYQNQIAANGDQPLESARTRPYHYRAYNLAAMITNARLGAYVGYDAWNITTGNGTTIKSALDYAILQSPGSETASELYPDVAAVTSVYGDPEGVYSKFLLENEGTSYPSDPTFLWDQPLSDSGIVSTTNTTASSSGTPSTAVANSWQSWMLLYGACTVVMSVSVLESFC